MRPTRTLSILAMSALAASAADAAPGALEVRFQPADKVYVHPIQGVGSPGDLFTAVLQNVAFVNRTAGAVRLESAVLDVERAGRTAGTAWSRKHKGQPEFPRQVQERNRERQLANLREWKPGRYRHDRTQTAPGGQRQHPDPRAEQQRCRFDDYAVIRRDRLHHA